MFCKCPAHGVRLPVPRKPASELGRSSQLRTRQGACAGQTAALSQTVTSPGTASPLGLCIWVFTHASSHPPPRARNGLSPGSTAAGRQPTQVCGNSLRAPWLQQADHKQGSRSGSRCPAGRRPPCHSAAPGVWPSPSVSLPATCVSTGSRRPGLADLHNLGSFKSPLS